VPEVTSGRLAKRLDLSLNDFKDDRTAFVHKAVQVARQRGYRLVVRSDLATKAVEEIEVWQGSNRLSSCDVAPNSDLLTVYVAVLIRAMNQGTKV